MVNDNYPQTATKLGPYKLNTIVTGDALELAKVIPNESIDLIVIDPPYNCGKDYGPHWNDSLPEDEYLIWYRQVCTESFRVLRNGYLYVSCTVPQLWTLRPLWEEAGFRFQVLLIWHGANYPNRVPIRSQWRLLYEPIFMFLKGPKLSMINAFPAINTDAVLQYSRPQGNYRGHKQRVHIVQKPLGLYQALIARTPGQIVLDWFVGSGTTAMAAKSLGRNYLAFEIDPATADLARQRVANTPPPLFIMPQPEQTTIASQNPMPDLQRLPETEANKR